MTESPKLQYPEVNDFENPTFERRDSVVRRWAHDLPVLNVAKTVPELVDQLPLLVREPLAANERLRLLEFFRTPVNSVVAAAENRRLRQTPISSGARQRIKDDVLTLCFELTAGYKVVLRDLLERGRTPAEDKQLLLTTQRILEQQRNALFHSYRIYRAVPPRHFQEMHQLHLYADRCEVATREIADDATPRGDRTPRTVYLHAMLLAVADPFRLVDGAIEELYRFLGKHAPSCRLTPGLIGDPRADAMFLLRADSDLPPALYGRAKLDRAGEVPYTLDATPLLHLLGRPKDADGESLETYAGWLLPRFKVAWERAAPRHQVDKMARIACGLEAANFLLSANGRQILSGTNGTAPGIEVQELEDEEATTYTMETWKVVNESLNGFMLSHPEQEGLGIRVGDLVLIVVEGTGKLQPVIAVVRWMGAKEGHMQCGIEILPGQPAAVTLESVLPNPEMPRGRGLYLPAVKSVEAPPTLVAPKGLHGPKTRLRVITNGKKQVVRCGELLTATEHVERFRFGRA